MDALDLRIARALGVAAWDARDRSLEATRPATLARKLGVRDELVRDRIAKMEADGVLAGYEIYPNFRHLDMDATTFHYRLPDERLKTRAIDEALAFDGVFGVYGYLGPTVCVDLCSRTPADRARRLHVLGRLMGTDRPPAIWARQLPVVERELDGLDWRIIQTLRGNARRPLDEVADLLQTSVRTVRRRLTRMASEGSIDIAANFDPTQVEGNVVVELHIWLHGGAATGPDRQTILESIEDRWFHAWAPPDSDVAGLVAMIVGSSIADVERLRGQVESLEIVRSVDVLVPSRAAYDASWIDEIVAERVAQLS